jgi:hypothetical protein
MIREKRVPNTDNLVLADGLRVFLTPRGLPNRPQTERELLSAIICVLEALTVGTEDSTISNGLLS